MKHSALFRRFSTSIKVIRREPLALLRLPGFLIRAVRESPTDTLTRLRHISDPLRHVQNYSAWAKEYHDATVEQLASMEKWAASIADPPLISVVMPVYNPKPPWLRDAIESVKSQRYHHWQLCIADDCSTDPEIRKTLEEEQKKDSRIQVVFREKNGHISRCSNSALELAQGSWVALLDHDDLLPPDALIWVARKILEDQDAQLIYSDEDKIDGYGERSSPYFKPDWNPSLIEGQNLFSHLGVYRTDLLRRVGGFRVGFEGSQDYDLLLRCVDCAGHHSVRHIPRVLYHWRVHQQSTASGNGAKPYVVAAAEKALQEHVQRLGIEGTVEALPQGYRIQRRPPQTRQEVDVLLDLRGASVRDVLRSLRSFSHSSISCHFHVAFSSDQYNLSAKLTAWCRKQAISLSCREADLQASRASTYQQIYQDGKAPLVLCWDMRLTSKTSAKAECSKWLLELVSQINAQHVVAVGPRLSYRNGKIASAGLFLSRSAVALPAHRGFGIGESGYFGRANLSQNVSALPWPGLLVCRQSVDAVGGLLEDPRLAPHAELDLCLRLAAQKNRIVFTPFADLIWRERAYKDVDPWPGSVQEVQESAALLIQKWQAQFSDDPALSPNLCNDPIDFSLAMPPRLQPWQENTELKKEESIERLNTRFQAESP